jgi:hypothetical protein
MIKQNAVPAAIMLLANSGAILSVPATVVAAAKASPAAPSAMPIVATLTATNEASEPARLQAWVGELVKSSATPSLEVEGPPLGRCGTISGSPNAGWDDSRQDC